MPEQPDDNDQEFYDQIAAAADADERANNIPQNEYLRELFRRL